MLGLNGNEIMQTACLCRNVCLVFMTCWKARLPVK